MSNPSLSSIIVKLWLQSIGREQRCWLRKPDSNLKHRYGDYGDYGDYDDVDWLNRE